MFGVQFVVVCLESEVVLVLATSAPLAYSLVSSPVMAATAALSSSVSNLEWIFTRGQTILIAFFMLSMVSTPAALASLAFLGKR